MHNYRYRSVGFIMSCLFLRGIYCGLNLSIVSGMIPCFRWRDNPWTEPRVRCPHRVITSAGTEPEGTHVPYWRHPRWDPACYAADLWEGRHCEYSTTVCHLDMCHWMSYCANLSVSAG